MILTKYPSTIPWEKTKYKYTNTACDEVSFPSGGKRSANCPGLIAPPTINDLRDCLTRLPLSGMKSIHPKDPQAGILFNTGPGKMSDSCWHSYLQEWRVRQTDLWYWCINHSPLAPHPWQTHLDCGQETFNTCSLTAVGEHNQILALWGKD